MVTSLGIGHLKKQFLQVLHSLWRRKYSLLILLFVLLKLIRVKMDKLSSQSIAKAIVTHDPLSLYDPNKGTFQALNRTDMTFLIKPKLDQVCPPHSFLLILALSSLANRQRRNVLREQVEKTKHVGIVFLLAETSSEELQQEIEEESNLNGDLLQVDSTVGSIFVLYLLNQPIQLQISSQLTCFTFTSSGI